MPCPFFEPREVAVRESFPNARVPLLEEHDGRCHAQEEVVDAPKQLRFGCCNQGYSRECCPHFPPFERRSALRFDVLKSGPGAIELLLVTESEHFPVAWERFRYVIGAEILEPEAADLCARAQIIAFCRSYLRRFF